MDGAVKGLFSLIKQLLNVLRICMLFFLLFGRIHVFFVELSS